MRFILVVKSGLTTLANIEGVSRDPRHITDEDARKVIEVEQYLERMFGLRFHINQTEDR